MQSIWTSLQLYRQLLQKSQHIRAKNGTICVGNWAVNFFKMSMLYLSIMLDVFMSCPGKCCSKCCKWENHCHFEAALNKRFSACVCTCSAFSASEFTWDVAFSIEICGLRNRNFLFASKCKSVDRNSPYFAEIAMQNLNVENACLNSPFIDVQFFSLFLMSTNYLVFQTIFTD